MFGALVGVSALALGTFESVKSAEDVESLFASESNLTALREQLEGMPEAVIRRGIAAILEGEHEPILQRRALLILQRSDISISGSLVATLRKSLEKEEPILQKLALRVLQDRGITSAELSATAADVFCTAEDTHVRIAVVEYLAAVSPSQGDAVLIEIAKKKEVAEDVRYRAVRALGTMRKEADLVVPILIRILDEKAQRPFGFSAHFYGSVPIAYDAAIALGKLGEKAGGALPKLISLLHSKDVSPAVRVGVAHAIIRIKGQDDRAARVLARSISHDSWLSRFLTMKAIQALDNSQIASVRQEIFDALSTVIRGRGEEELINRISAAEALMTIGGAEARGLLRTVLQEEEDDWVREVFLEMLSEGDKDESDGSTPSLPACNQN